METKMELQINELRRHAERLATKHQVHLVQNPDHKPEEAVAFPSIRTVLCYPVVEEVSYAIAMHEMGHVIAIGGTGRVKEGMTEMQMVMAMMDQEDSAWGWAITHALYWTEAMEHWKNWARETYRA
jgi:hypothetical protein